MRLRTKLEIGFLILIMIFAIVLLVISNLPQKNIVISALLIVGMVGVSLLWFDSKSDTVMYHRSEGYTYLKDENDLSIWGKHYPSTLGLGERILFSYFNDKGYLVKRKMVFTDEISLVHEFNLKHKENSDD